MSTVDELIIKTVFKDSGAVKGLSKINSLQAKTLKNSKNIAKTNKETEKSYSALGNALRYVAGFIGIREITRYADEWTSIRSILKLVTETEEERLRVEQRLFSLAQSTRQNIYSTVDLYRRITTSTESLGINEENRLNLVEAINKALIIGGGSTESQNAALIQLGQGLAAGVLRGEELNSILEQTPRLAQMIAEGMGLRVGDLRREGAKGALTAERVLNAIMNQASSVNDEFEKMDMTLAQSFVVLRNSVSRLISEDVGGFISLLAEGIALVANNTFILQTAFASLSAVITFKLVKSIVLMTKSLIVATKKFWLLITTTKIFTKAGFVETIQKMSKAVSAFAAASWATASAWVLIGLAIASALVLIDEFIATLKGTDSLSKKGLFKLLDMFTGQNKSLGIRTYLDSNNNRPIPTGVSNVRFPVSNNRTSNINQNITFNIREARNAKLTTKQIETAITNHLYKAQFGV